MFLLENASRHWSCTETSLVDFQNIDVPAPSCIPLLWCPCLTTRFYSLASLVTLCGLHEFLLTTAMGRPVGGPRFLTPWRHFLSDDPQKMALRVRLLIALDCAIVALVITSLAAPWYRQEWRVANGEVLAWTLSLGTAKFKVDCSSDSPEFLDLCKTLYGRLGGDLRAITRSICSAGDKVRDTDLQALLQETCSDVKLIERLSVATGAGSGSCVCLMVFGIAAILLHMGYGFRNRTAWRAGFWCHAVAWVLLTASCVLYSIAIPKVEDLFHFQPPLNVAFDPAHAEPVKHELLYGFITAIATAGALAIYMPFWWKVAPFDPDPYFLEPRGVRQALAK